MMGEFLDFLKNKKNLINILLLGILILGIPLGVNILRKQQIIKSRAVNPPIVFKGENVKQLANGQWVAFKPQISLELTSPLGPPATPTPTPSPVPKTAPTNLSEACSSNGSQVILSWTAPASGSSPTSYTIRVNKNQDVWRPGEEDSGDFVDSPASTTDLHAIAPGAEYGWSVQANPGNNDPIKRRTAGGSFSCSSSGEKTVITQPVAGESDAPTGLKVDCGSNGSSVTFSWAAPSSGGTPTPYIVRVNKNQDVWRPGEEDSGDFTKDVTSTTSNTLSITPNAEYGYSIQAIPNSGSFDRRTDGGTFSCSGPAPTPAPVANTAPYNLASVCGAASGDSVPVAFSWSAPNAGTTPTGYTLRVNRTQDVWCPASCSNSNTPCADECGSGDFIPADVTTTSYLAALVPGEKYGWSIQANPGTSDPQQRRLAAGAFSCAADGTLTQISPPAAPAADTPANPQVSCITVNSQVVQARFSWSAPASGGDPSPYTLRVNNEKDVWAPESCSGQTAVCEGVNGSGDFVPSTFNTTSYRALVKPSILYGWSVQANPNNGSLDRRTEGSFTCQ